jgi:hypothetical protein
MGSARQEALAGLGGPFHFLKRLIHLNAPERGGDYEPPSHPRQDKDFLCPIEQSLRSPQRPSLASRVFPLKHPRGAVPALAVPASAASMPAPSITESCVVASASVPLPSVRVSTTIGPNADTSPILLATEFDRGRCKCSAPARQGSLRSFAFGPVVEQFPRAQHERSDITLPLVLRSNSLFRYRIVAPFFTSIMAIFAIYLEFNLECAAGFSFLIHVNVGSTF